MRRPALLGAAILLGFFVVGGGWAATAPISGAAVAPGVVSPEGSRRRVQHLEGGLIREIRVSDGDRVRAGDVLMVLADIGAQSEVGQSLSRLRALAATEARLEAERRGSDKVAFDHPALKDRDQAEVREVIEQQVNQLITRRANDASQEIHPHPAYRSATATDSRRRKAGAERSTAERADPLDMHGWEVEIDREQLRRLDPQIELMPGMPAEAFIATAERTVLEYLLQPFLLVVEHSFRER